MDELHIFGASGAVGSFLVKRLREQQRAAIVCTHRTPVPITSGAPLHWRQIDLWRDTSVSAATEIISAGPLDALATWLARSPTPKLRRVVALSSMSIEAKRDSPDPAERELAASLQRSEQSLSEICAQRDIGWTLLRPTLIWGAGRDRSLTSLFRFGKRFGFVPMPNLPGGLRQPVHAMDVADACLQALEAVDCSHSVMAVGGGEQLPVAEMWGRVASAASARRARMPLGLLVATSAMIGSRGQALRTALQRWQQNQTADRAIETCLRNWQPRDFDPRPDDFEPASR